MSFGGGSGGGGSISGATDVNFSNQATDDFMRYDGTVSKWTNTPLNGTVALATKGGEETVNYMTAQSGAVTLDVATGNVFSFGLSGSVTFTFADAAYNKASSFGLYLYSAGGLTVTWPTNVKWADGIKPTLTGTSTNPDILVFETINGSTWYGSLVGNNFQ